MNTYPKYKDSGEQWLGQIPEHWEMRQWRFLLKENVTPNTDCKETRQLQFKYGEIIPKANQEIDSDTLKIICKYNKVQPNDIMINGLNLNYDFISQRIGMVQTNGIITSAYISLRPIGSANPSYYNYLLKAMDAQKMFHGMGTGVRLTLSYKELKSKYLPFPTEAEQEAMVAYLDEQTAQIDSAIAREQKMIDLLEERKQIIIQQAVTKGLNPNATMKDSGVEWIGEIPEGWEVRRLKYLLSSNLMYGANESAESEDRSFPRYIRITDIDDRGHLREETFRSLPPSKAEPYLLKKGDVLFARSGATAGKTYLFDEDIEACFAGYLIKASLKDNILPNYLTYYTKSGFYDNWKKSIFIQATIPNIGADKYANLLVILPTREDQEDIVEYLDEHMVGINRAIEAREKMIALLQERKQIIINEVVTGKIKVL